MGNENCRHLAPHYYIDHETRTVLQHQDRRSFPLTFHDIHGTNISILKKGQQAKHNDSSMQGLAFSNRPIAVNEMVGLVLNEVNTSWSGVLRFGVTNKNPTTYRSFPMPQLIGPHLRRKEGFWAKELPKIYSKPGNILHFYVNRSGELFYGINGEQKGKIMSGITVNQPMWVVLDIYGHSLVVEFVDSSKYIESEHVPPPITFPSLRQSTISDVSRSAISTAAPSTSSLPVSLSTFTGSHYTRTLESIEEILERYISNSSMRRAERATSDVLPTRTSLISTSSVPDLPQTSNSSGNEDGNQDDTISDECSICMNARVNSVLYTCGHMCMCYSCARRVMQTDGTCPICRAVVIDVIKIFRA